MKNLALENEFLSELVDLLDGDDFDDGDFDAEDSELSGPERYITGKKRKGYPAS